MKDLQRPDTARRAKRDAEASIPVWRLVTRADANRTGRARYIARQAALFQAAGTASPPVGTD